MGHDRRLRPQLPRHAAGRRRLRYESWHLIHLYGYLGAGLALPHQLWTGQEFLASTASTVFWWGLYAVCAASVLVFRVGLPLARSLRSPLRVVAVHEEAPGVTSVVVGGPGVAALRPAAGQFFQWRFVDGPGWTRANPYSLSAAPDGKHLRVTAAQVGDGTRRLADLRPGTRVLVEGPYGRLSARARIRPKVALIGAGVGVTPLRALAEALEYAPGDAVLLYRYSGGDPLFRRELEALAAERGLEVIWLPGHRRSAGSWSSPSSRARMGVMPMPAPMSSTLRRVRTPGWRRPYGPSTRTRVPGARVASRAVPSPTSAAVMRRLRPSGAAEIE